MTEKYRFFDPLQDDNGVFDREYNAQEFTDYFKALVTTGVMKGASSELEVSVNGSSMISTVNTGIAFLLGRYYENDSPLELTHDTETLGISRIDRIVLRMDLSTEARYVRAFIKKGVASKNPIAPTLTQTSNLYEISLAQVKIVGGQTYISVNDVTDERGQDGICPWAGSNILPNFNDQALQQLIADFEVVEGTVNTLNNNMYDYVLNYINRNSQFYVDAVNGDDMNSGVYENQAFKTIQKAFDEVKKFSPFTVYINVAAGTYVEDASLWDAHGGQIVMRGTYDDMGQAGPTKIHGGFSIYNSNINLTIEYFEILPRPYGTGISFTGYSGTAGLNEIHIPNRYTNWGTPQYEKHVGVKVDGACVVKLDYCTISNAKTAVQAIGGAHVIDGNTTGDTNDVAYQAQSATIQNPSTFITATTMHEKSHGGQIISNSGALL